MYTLGETITDLIEPRDIDGTLVSGLATVLTANLYTRDPTTAAFTATIAEIGGTGRYTIAFDTTGGSVGQWYWSTEWAGPPAQVFSQTVDVDEEDIAAAGSTPVLLGETASESFATGVVGETFSRTASFIDGVATVFNPTFSDLGGGFYRYSYVTTATGPHEWVGNGSSSGALAINFDVVETLPGGTSTTYITNENTYLTQQLPPMAAAFQSGTSEERLPVRFDLTGEWAIIQGADWDWPIRLDVDTQPAPPFEASGAYVLGNYCTPTNGNETGFTYLCVVAGTAGASEPDWPEVLGGRVVSGSVGFMAVGASRMLDTSAALARMHVRTEPGGTLLLLASVENGRVFLDYDPPTWAASTAYTLGDRVMSQTLNGWVYECVDAGTSGGSAPTWPTTLGTSVGDGGVVWRSVMTDEGASNLRVQLTNAVTEALTNLGPCRFDIEYYDAFGVTTRILEGNAELSEEITLTIEP